MEEKHKVIRFIKFVKPKGLPPRLARFLDEINDEFTHRIITYKPRQILFTPYVVRITELIPKNEWTKGTYVAINRDDNTLDLQLNFKKILEEPRPLKEKLPVLPLTWVLFHEFRHKQQRLGKILGEAVNNNNWQEFKKYIMKVTGKDEDLIEHIFHELNPAEVDANIYASSMMGFNMNGNAFDITPDKLKLLEKEGGKI